MSSTDCTPATPLPIASSSAGSRSPLAASRTLTSVPMRRSPASIGVPRSASPQQHQPFVASAVTMSRFSVNNSNTTTNSSAPRRMPAAVPMGRELPNGGVAMGRGLPYGGVAMERSKASMGTDYNPFYVRRQTAQAQPRPACRQTDTTPRTPVRARTLAPIAFPQYPSTPASLPSPPASPTTPTPMSSARAFVHEDKESSLLGKRSVLTPRAFPVAFPVAFPDSPRSVRPRRRRGLSAPPPLHLRSSTCAILVVDGTRSLRVSARTSGASARPLPFHAAHAKSASAALVRADQ